MQHPTTDIGSSDPCWDKEEQITSVHVLLTLETMVSRKFRILVFEGNPVSCVQTGDNGKPSSALTGLGALKCLPVATPEPGPT